MSKTEQKPYMSQTQDFSFTLQPYNGGMPSEDENQSSPNMVSQFSTQKGNCYCVALPNYESDRHALSLSFGTRPSRRTCNNYQQGCIASDVLPSLCNLVNISDRRQSEYHSLQRNCSSGPENVCSQLQCLKVSIQLNNKRNEEGERFKFLEGDEIKGYVTISNCSKKKLPYTACLVTLVGYISVKTRKKFNVLYQKKIIHRFLSMVDYDASNSLSNSDDVGSSIVVDKENSYALNETKKIYIEPSTSRRESFKFKLPEHLANCACQIHNLQQHCGLLPTFDLRTNSGSMLQKWFKKGLRSLSGDTLENKRLGSPDSEASISYNVEAKVIGEISDYQEYLYSSYRAIEKKLLKRLIIIDKANVTICVLPTSDLVYLDQELFGILCKEIYHDLIERAQKKVYSNEKRVSIEKLPSVCKIQQLYTSDKDISPKTAQTLNGSKMGDGNISTDLFLSLPNSLGTTSIILPAMLLNISSSPPYMRANGDNINHTPYTRRIPINLEFTPCSLKKSYKFPKVSKVSLELVALTFMSRTLPIPIAINHDILFGKKKITDDKVYDPFEEQIRKPFRSLFINMNMTLIKKDDCQLLLDLRSLAYMEYEYESTFVPTLEDSLSGEVSKIVSSTPWKLSGSKDHNHFKKTINIDIYATEMKKTLEKIHWIPEFQSCFMGRLYFCKINIKMRNMHDISIYMPLSIMRGEDNA